MELYNVYSNIITIRYLTTSNKIHYNSRQIYYRYMNNFITVNP